MEKEQINKIDYRKISELKGYDNNARIHSDKQVKQIMNSITEFGFNNPILIDEDDIIIAGHGRIMASKKLKLKQVPTIKLTHLTDKQKKAYLIADNRLSDNSYWDMELLKHEVDDLLLEGMDMDLLGFDVDFFELDEDIKNFNDTIDKEDDTYSDGVKGSLQDKFIAPPFSILDAKQGYWQDRKKKWLDIGLKSEEGRENLETTVASKSIDKGNNDGGGSVFDPVLCEIGYAWFSRYGDKVIDPFAGGSVRGVIAGKLGREYTGIDLRKNQVEANFNQSLKINRGDDKKPDWICGDSNVVLDKLEADSYDFCLSCPPYADLEVYSDDPADLSNMSYEEFNSIYSSIISKLYRVLKEDSFVFWVIGEVRDSKGNYYNFTGDTIKAFVNAGFNYYNEIILATPIGSSALRAGNQFKKGRKVCKTHQNVLVFCKGDGKNITKRLGDVEVDILSD